MGTWILSAVLLALFVLAAVYVVKKKKSGGCVGCPGSANCHCDCAANGSGSMRNSGQKAAAEK